MKDWILSWKSIYDFDLESLLWNKTIHINVPIKLNMGFTSLWNLEIEQYIYKADM